jgi:ribonuclease P protein component
MKRPNEKNVSAIKSQEARRPRFPQTDVDQERTRRAQTASGEGAQTTDRARRREVTVTRSQAFPLHCRLKSPLAIRAILQNSDSGRRRYDAFRVVWSVHAPDRRLQRLADAPRFAFVVSRRAGPAHVRNRIKRRLRESVRLQRDIWPGAAAVVFATDSGLAARLPFTSLFDQVRESLLWMRNQAPAKARDERP